MKRIGVLTSGGDAPGMNAAIRAVVRTAAGAGKEIVGIRRGYSGLIAQDFVPLTARDVGGILELGGTFLESARCPEFRTPEGQQSGIAALERAGIEGLIVIGGNGSQTGAAALSATGFPVNGVASTIDNDLSGSDLTIGVDTALNIALETIDRLRTTASSHRRLFIVEVMGRDCGYLALTSGLAGGAEVIVTPERPYNPQEVVECIRAANARGKRHAIVVVAEGSPHNGTALYDAIKCCEDPGFSPRLSILGHVQRGGRPTAFDRLLAIRLASRATELLLNGRQGFLVGLLDGCATPTPYSDVVGRTKPLPEELLALVGKMEI